jgi:hypothetical protein
MKGRAMKRSIACAIAVTMVAGATLSTVGNSTAGALPVNAAVRAAGTTDIVDVRYRHGGGIAAQSYCAPYYYGPGYYYATGYYCPRYAHGPIYYRSYVSYGAYSSWYGAPDGWYGAPYGW